MQRKAMRWGLEKKKEFSDNVEYDTDFGIERDSQRWRSIGLDLSSLRNGLSIWQLDRRVRGLAISVLGICFSFQSKDKKLVEPTIVEFYELKNIFFHGDAYNRNHDGRYCKGPSRCRRPEISNSWYRKRNHFVRLG